MDMKHWLGGLLAALMLFSLTACGLFVVDLTDIPANAEVTEGIQEKQELLPETDMEETGAPGGESEEGGEAALPPEDASKTEDAPALPEDGIYTSKEDVSLYIHLYSHLPDNFITKKEAQELGWPGGDLEPYAPGKCIGGSRFGNYEGRLPEAEGRSYTECDIDTLGAKSRGAKRIVFSNDGLIYYTEDHYETFELLYGDEGDG